MQRFISNTFFILVASLSLFVTDSCFSYSNITKSFYDLSCTYGGFSFDLLIWETCRPNLDYAGVGLIPVDIFKIDSKFDCGFRLGIHKRVFNGTKVELLYTHFTNNLKSHLNEGSIVPTRLILDVDQAPIPEYKPPLKSGYQLNLNYLDIQIVFNDNPYCYDILLQPFLAIRYTSLKENMSTFYTIEPETDGSMNLKEGSRTSGTGGIIGCQGCFYLFPCISFDGRISIGGHFGNHHLNTNQFSLPSSGSTETPILNTNLNNVHTFFTSELSIGLTLDLPQICLYLPQIHFGYEMNNWYDLSDFLQIIQDSYVISSSRNSTNLALHGFYLRADVNF